MLKYRNKPTNCRQGHRHLSIKEAVRCNELTILERGGFVKWLKQQPVFTLQTKFEYRGNIIKPITYRADFSYFDVESKKFTVEDVKGVRTELYKVKRKILIFTMRDRDDFQFLET